MTIYREKYNAFIANSLVSYQHVYYFSHVQSTCDNIFLVVLYSSSNIIIEHRVQKVSIYILRVFPQDNFMGVVAVIASLDLTSYYFLKCEYIIHRKDKINTKLSAYSSRGMKKIHIKRQ